MDKFEEIPQGWIIHGDLEEKLYFLANILYICTLAAATERWHLWHRNTKQK